MTFLFENVFAKDGRVLICVEIRFSGIRASPPPHDFLGYLVERNVRQGGGGVRGEEASRERQLSPVFFVTQS